MCEVHTVQPFLIDTQTHCTYSSLHSVNFTSSIYMSIVETIRVIHFFNVKSKNIMYNSYSMNHTWHFFAVSGLDQGGKHQVLLLALYWGIRGRGVCWWCDRKWTKWVLLRRRSNWCFYHYIFNSVYILLNFTFTGSEPYPSIILAIHVKAKHFTLWFITFVSFIFHIWRDTELNPDVNPTTRVKNFNAPWPFNANGWSNFWVDLGSSSGEH